MPINYLKAKFQEISMCFTNTFLWQKINQFYTEFEALFLSTLNPWIKRVGVT